MNPVEQAREMDPDSEDYIEYASEDEYQEELEEVDGDVESINF